MIDLDQIERLARLFLASGLTALKRWEEAAVILLLGQELGLPPLQALRGVHVVSGRPVLSADLLVAIARRSGLCESWVVVESTDERCTIETRRKGEATPRRRTWAAADAKRAGIAGRGTWAAYPAQMLRHRCAADLAREVYPDVCLGLYTADELGGEEPAQVSVSTPASLPAPRESRAWAAYQRAVLEYPTVQSVYEGYRDLASDLREEGHEPSDYTRIAADLSARRLSDLGHYLAAADVTAVLAGSEVVIGGLDSQGAALGAGAAEPAVCARWWVDHRGEYERDVAARLYLALARRCGGDVTEGKRALAAAVEAIVAASWEPVVTSDGVEIDSEEGARARIWGLHPVALGHSYRRHREHAGWSALCVQRVSETAGCDLATARARLEAEAT